MRQYFDKDFFKFLLGFVAIIAFSLAIILVARSYQNKSETQTPLINVAKSAAPKP